MKLASNHIYCGDCLELMQQLPAESIDCIITSPPYWGLRDYGVLGQIGQELYPERYIENIIALMKEAKRVLKPTGTIFLNLGDSFYRQGSAGVQKRGWLQPKQKLLIPYRIAIRCQDEIGLILRNDLHWIKQWANVATKESSGRCVPSAVRDRFTTHSESIFFFSKQKRYFFNLDAVRMPHKAVSIRKRKINYNSTSKYGPRPIGGYHPKGKNPGDCLHFPYEPSKERHTAMFPSIIPDFFIRCGCPSNGIVLDPFMGSGTTALVAQRLHRKFIGFEISPQYCKIIRRRLQEDCNHD